MPYEISILFWQCKKWSKGTSTLFWSFQRLFGVWHRTIISLHGILCISNSTLLLSITISIFNKDLNDIDVEPLKSILVVITHNFGGLIQPCCGDWKSGVLGARKFVACRMVLIRLLLWRSLLGRHVYSDAWRYVLTFCTIYL